MSVLSALEIWGGLECTVNRVGDRYLDQLRRSGHHLRLDDIDRFAELGINAIRYPLLWERIAPEGLEGASYRWSDRRLARLREVGIRPIVGLLHHGSGPRETDLMDAHFPEKFAAYASAVASRYPWIDEWTPINEPVTTARFSGLYGHWYPHKREGAAFLRMLVNQCRATVLAMESIRRTNPSARFVHTDDGGTVVATPPLSHQAAFENQRRDLALDLLFGRVDHRHPLWGYLMEHGVAEPELEQFLRHPCPPDTIGVNYYVTSDRMLDHRLGCYPPSAHGGNGTQLYADVAAVHGSPGQPPDFASVLTRYWRSYRRPVALTEVHLGCTRDEQLRWLAEAWSGARTAAASGVQVRALCVWSLLGSYDWDQLVTGDSGHYESGVFDVRGPSPRRTALHAATRAMVAGVAFEHPAASGDGWWRRHSGPWPQTGVRRCGQRLLVLGASGTLGRAMVRCCRRRGLDYLALSRQEVDVTQTWEVKRVISACRPWAVINATGYANVDAAERERETCRSTNTFGAWALAEASARVGAALATFSSDLVFDGERATPYLEGHAVNPLNSYGSSKVAAEVGVLERMPSALVIRTSAFFDPCSAGDFAAQVASAVARDEPLFTSGDVVSPTYVPALADVVLNLLIDGESGLWHMATPAALSWTDFGRRLAAALGGNESLITEGDDDALGRIARRPRYSALGSERGTLLPSLEQSMELFLAERQAMPAQGANSRDAAVAATRGVTAA